MRRLGSEVTVLQRGNKIMDKDDPAAGEIILDVFKEEGIDVRFGSELQKVEPRDGRLCCTIKHGDHEHELIVDKNHGGHRTYPKCGKPQPRSRWR